MTHLWDTAAKPSCSHPLSGIDPAGLPDQVSSSQCIVVNISKDTFWGALWAKGLLSEAQKAVYFFSLEVLPQLLHISQIFARDLK